MPLLSRSSMTALPPRRRAPLADSVAVPLALAMLAAAPGAARADAAQPRLVVGFAPGGGLDGIARAVAQEMGKALGRPVVVENRPGAGGSLAAQFVAASPPDGSTMLFADTTLLTSPHVLKGAKYDAQKSFAPVMRLAEVPLILAANPTVPAGTPQALVDAIKASPGKYAFATAGIATMHHFGGEMFKQAAGVDMVHVAYKGGAPAMQDLIGGQVPLAIASLPAVAPAAKSQRVRMIATLSGQRLPAYPDLPALSETLPGFDVSLAVFVLAPAGTPGTITGEMAAALRAAMATPELRAAFESQGAVAAPLDAASLGAWMRAEEARWATLIEKKSITLE